MNCLPHLDEGHAKPIDAGLIRQAILCRHACARESHDVLLQKQEDCLLARTSTANQSREGAWQAHLVAFGTQDRTLPMPCCSRRAGHRLIVSCSTGRAGLDAEVTEITLPSPLASRQGHGCLQDLLVL